ncbi:MAG TPA: hypothetical protein VHQ43_08370 [Solirubrobacterales bacterium]|jgi:hypothetical protein|nr:hypothetical protein [Solirubrobacterales bacterium]
MTRIFKAIGLVCLIAYAAGVLSTSAASAHTFDYEFYHTLLMAEAKSEQILTTAAVGETKCKKVSLSPTDPLNTKLWGVGETNGHASITLRPIYSECSMVIPGLGTVKPTIEFTSCYFEITGETTAGTEHAPVHVRCETPGDEIHVKVGSINAKCYTIPPQTVEGAHYTNTGAQATRDIVVNSTITDMDVTREGICGSGLEKNATYQGEITLKGTNTEEGQVGIWATP